MDAFISYRHGTGSLYALEIYEFLTKECNMDVFYDKEGFYNHAGEFPKVLEENILNADNFILILTDLNADIDYEKSVFINEIRLALENNKRIIVIKGNSFVFPADLHPYLTALPDMQALDISDATYFRGVFKVDLLSKMAPTKKRDDALNRMMFTSKLESRRTIEGRLSLAERLGDNVKSVDICATACQGMLSHAREHIERLMQNGCKFRVIMNHPDSAAAKDAYTKKISGGGERHRKRIIPQAYEDLMDWQADYPKTFAGKTTEEFLPGAIFIIHTNEPQKDTIKVDYYSFGSTDEKRRSIYIHSGDVDNFNFYVEQFEWLWEHADPIVIEENEND